MLLVDVHEPIQVVELLQQAVPVSVQPLNERGQADYFWFAVDGHRVQVERKQWPELLANIDKVEEQLDREVKKTDEQWLAVEGVPEPTQYGIDCFKRHDTKTLYTRSRRYGTKSKPQPYLMARVESWFWKLDKRGITVRSVSNIHQLVTALVYWYKNSQDPGNRMLDRYIKPLVRGESKDPQVLALMAIPRSGIGEVRAKSLIKKFGTAWQVWNEDVTNLSMAPAMGRSAAETMLRAIGRPEESW